jgi:galactokinase
VAWALLQAGYDLRGWQGAVKGDVPIGAGLSSSAALEMAVMQAFAVVSGFAWDAPQMAKLGQKVENEWVGVNSGIMDQMISASGRAGSALLIDCRSLETELVPLPPDVVVVILDTSTRRGLAGSAYNDRRASCERAAAAYGVAALRDLSVAEFEAGAARLDDITRKRAQHVITENERVLAAREALKQDDAAAFGQLMNASHISMRDDFEISSDALNAIVTCAQNHAACYGARMTGGGFAGCAVALVEADSAEVFVAHVADCYTTETGLSPQIYITPPTNGAEVFPAETTDFQRKG